MAFICDLTNRLRNSAIFLPLLYFIIGASIYYSWSLSSQNTEVLMKLSMVNAALTATNGDLLKTNTKLKMCYSKESAFTKSNRDLHLSLSKSEDQVVQLNENLALEMKSKQKFLSNFELLFKSMMNDPGEFVKSDSLDSVFNNMQLIKKRFNAELERFNKEKVELQDEMKTKITRLEDQLKIFNTQNDIFRQKLKECNTIITSLNDNIEELKHQQTKMSEERGINIKKEILNDNTKMINLNADDKPPNDKTSSDENVGTQMPKTDTIKVSQTSESPITSNPEIYVTASTASTIEKDDEEEIANKKDTKDFFKSNLKKNTSTFTEPKSKKAEKKSLQVKKKELGVEEKETEKEDKEVQSTKRKDELSLEKQSNVQINNKNSEATQGGNLEESLDEEHEEGDQTVNSDPKEDSN